MIRPDHARTLHALHAPDREGLILPNAWDAASARTLEHAGAPAIGTTSAGIAFALGYPDGETAPVEDLLDALARIVAATTRPVTADLEGGYAQDPDGVAVTVTRALHLGVASHARACASTSAGSMCTHARTSGSRALTRARHASVSCTLVSVPAFMRADTSAIDSRLSSIATPHE